MGIRPDGSEHTVLAGDFEIDAVVPGGARVQDSFRLKIHIPPRYPEEVPRVFETGGRIPRGGRDHVNDDGSLCLGSPLRLMMHLGEDPSLVAFARHCIIPFLYAFSHRQQKGGELVFGELAHAIPGLLDDYGGILKLKEPKKIAQALKRVLEKKRIANKRPCPCGCKRRLGKCDLHNRINLLRKLVPKSWLRDHIGNK